MPNLVLIVAILAAVIAPAVTYVKTKSKRKAGIAFLIVAGIWATLGLIDAFFIE